MQIDLYLINTLSRDTFFSLLHKKTGARLLHGCKDSNGTFFLRPCVPYVNLVIVLQCRQLFQSRDAGTLLRDIFMCPAQRDSITGYVFASLCPLRQFSNFAMSATFPIQGRRDFIAGHFYVSRSTGLYNVTLF